ncbi:MAG: hypothetical protein II347_02325, partial [Lachnospiraceae bacterium]|nr:hypothetical protein [Lachnospiraceae bacterium]
MEPKRKLRRILVFVLGISIIFACFYSFYYMRRMIPQTLRVVKGQQSDVRLPLPITATLRSEDGMVELEASGARISDIPSDQIHIMLDEGFS